MDKAGLTIADISSVGLGTPGTVNENGIIEFANNLGFNNVPAREMLKERLGDLPIYIDNDANCAALGEAYAGCGNGSQNFVAVTLGTGVGSGIIVNGKIVTGVNCAGGGAVIWLLWWMENRVPAAEKAAGRRMPPPLR